MRVSDTGPATTPPGVPVPAPVDVAAVDDTAVGVTAVVVTYDSARVLPAFLAALPAAFDGVSSWQLTVADNDSSDGGLDVVAELAPWARRVRTGSNGGYSAGLNRAIAAGPASGAYLVLNPDVRLEPGCVAELLAALDEPGIGIAVPRLADEQGRVAWSMRREPTVLRALGEAVLGGDRAGRVPALGERVLDPALYDEPGRADWASGAAMLVSAGCARAVGDWDESFFLYSEETDYALRARDAGLQVRFVPQARALHLGGEMHTSPELFALMALNRWRLYRRRHGPAAALAYRLVLMLNSVLRIRSRQHRAALAGLLRGRSALLSAARVRAGAAPTPVVLEPSADTPGPALPGPGPADQGRRS